MVSCLCQLYDSCTLISMWMYFVLFLDKVMFWFCAIFKCLIGCAGLVDPRWEEERATDGSKWKFLEHSGPVFAPPYDPLPNNVKFYYDGKIEL